MRMAGSAGAEQLSKLSVSTSAEQLVIRLDQSQEGTAKAVEIGLSEFCSFSKMEDFA
jgi:hypothetical protein